MTILKLLKVVLAIPIGSSEAERGFSIMNAIKTQRRNRLLHSTVESNLIIRINGRDVEDMIMSPYVERAKARDQINLIRKSNPSKRLKGEPKDDDYLFPKSTLF